MDPTTPGFDGATFDPELDGERLTGQMKRVCAVMIDHQWHTIPELRERCAPASEAGISARLRDLRKPRYGSQKVERQRVEGGLFRYRLHPKEDAGA